MDGQTEGQCQNSIPPKHSLRGYKKKQLAPFAHASRLVALGLMAL